MRDSSVQGFLLYYCLQAFFVSTYLVGMALSLQLYLNPSFYIEAFCQDIKQTFKEAAVAASDSRQDAHNVNRLFLEMITFHIQIVK